jgi:hypothetical protein
MDDTVLALVKRTIDESKESLEQFLAGWWRGNLRTVQPGRWPL